MQGSELIANWVGALGSAGAAILAVVIYWVDKSASRQRESEARNSMRKGQAIHLAALLDTMVRQLAELEVSSHQNTSAPPALLTVAGPERLLEALRDPSVFTQEELTLVASVVAATAGINRAIAIHTITSGGSPYVLTKELPTEDIEAAREACAECSARMLQILDPKHLAIID